MNKNISGKDYLSKVYRLDQRIKAKLEQLEILNSLATKATTTLNDMPRSESRNTSRMEDTIIKIMDLQHEINDDINNLVDLKKMVSDAIHEIENPEYQMLLEYRYLCYRSWEQIAVDLEYSIQHTFRLHGKALKEIEKNIKMRVNERE
ncbi:MAG: DUF1492 domain-containing protein [Anaerovoracaceae bacterium]